jgi:hypothetical protein
MLDFVKKVLCNYRKRLRPFSFILAHRQEKGRSLSATPHNPSGSAYTAQGFA